VNGAISGEQEIRAMARSRLMCLFLDSAEKSLLLQWAEEGWLPNLRRLLAVGAWSVTQGPVGFSSAVWPTIATGVSPARHGRHSYKQIRPGTYETYLFKPSDLKAEPFWNAVGRAGRRVCVVDFPSVPLSRTLNGAHVVEWGLHDVEVGFCTWPPELSRQIRQRFGHDPVGICDQGYRGTEGLAALRDALVARVEKKTELLEYLLAAEDWDVFVAGFGESHCVGHRFWHLHDPTHPRHDEAQARVIGDPIRDVYVAIDAAIGRLFAKAAQGTMQVLVTSHGMGPDYHQYGRHLLEPVLERLGHTPRWKPSGITRSVLQRCWHLMPKRLRSAVAPAQRRLLDRMLEPRLDPSRPCFSMFNYLYAGVRLNLAGREPQGCIQPGAEADAFCERLAADLHALVDVDEGRPVVRRVMRTADLYQGPYLDDLPDLLIEWNTDFYPRAIRSPKTGEIPNELVGPRTGDHRLEGLICAAGPSIVPGRINSPVSTVDIAPTLAALAGVPLPGAEGQPILSIVPNGVAAQAI
jgi:predicted AlkP superfamily phosphohydrolase/phosphomutase